MQNPYQSQIIEGQNDVENWMKSNPSIEEIKDEINSIRVEGKPEWEQARLSSVRYELKKVLKAKMLAA